MPPPFSFFGSDAGRRNRVDPSGSTRPDKGQSRGHRRKTILRNPPRGELQSLSSGCWDVTIWDISRGGLCLVCRAQQLMLPQAENVSVRLYDPAGRDSLRLKATLCWIKHEGGDTYIGLEFRPGTTLPRGCFLEAYLTDER